MRSRLHSRLVPEDGVVTIIVALMMVVLLGFTALVIDLGRTRHAKQQVQDAVDFGSLAAATYLPVNGTVDPVTGKLDADLAKEMAAKITTGSTVGLSSGAVTTTFSCVLLLPQNSLAGPRPDLGNDLASACGPATNGTWNSAAGWVLSPPQTGATPPPAKRMTHACNPYAGDLCNAVKVQTAQTIDYLFAPSIGIKTGSTGAVQAVTCFGECKRRGSPLDVALVLDRTGSMSLADVQAVKDAAKELLKVYNPADQTVALLALPYAQPAPDQCKVASPQNYPDSAIGKWTIVGLSSNYKNPDGTLNTSSALVSTIDCLERAANPSIFVSGNNRTSAGHTNLGDPMAAAAAYLAANGRPTVPDVVIFMTDGQANQPDGLQPCSYAFNRATAAKATAEVYTIGYGLGPIKCNRDTSGTYRLNGGNDFATTTLSDMATPPPSGTPGDNLPGGCNPTDENGDGDHYFCTDPNTNNGGGALIDVFKQIAIQTLKTARLIDVD